jgi:hypothetical protein
LKGLQTYTQSLADDPIYRVMDFLQHWKATLPTRLHALEVSAYKQALEE